MATLSLAAAGQTAPAGKKADDADFKLSLANHAGQMQWKAEGFSVVESSGKPDGTEIGLRGRDTAGRVSFLGFLFVAPGNEPMTSAQCRDGVLDAEKGEPDFKISRSSEVARPDRIPVSVVDYSVRGQNGDPLYSVRGFVAAGEVCGDLEFYSSDAIRSEDPALLKAFQSFQLDPHYQPGFKDTFFFAQVLYNTRQFAAAAPVYELALARLKDAKKLDPITWGRLATDQAGMSYGISGDLKKARTIFESAIQKDPDYPLYYYNLACADAEEKNLADARKHLQQAFDRKANTVPGEKLPDPTKDDSFTPYESDKDFWSFLEGLKAKM